MSTEPESPLEEPAGAVSPGKPEGRGYFFYIAAFFVLIALLCYLLQNANITLTPPIVPPAPAAPSSPSK